MPGCLSGAGGRTLLAGNNLVDHFLAHRLNRLSVVTAEQILELTGCHLISLAHQHIKHCLCADNLGGRRNQRRLTAVLTNSGDLFQHILVFIFCLLLFQLAYHVGQHTAGNLITQRIDVNTKYLGAHQAGCDAFLTVRTEVVRDLRQNFLIISCIVLGTLKGLHHNLCRRLGSTQSERRNGTVNDIHARLNCFQIRHGSHAGCVVRMQLDRELCALL